MLAYVAAFVPRDGQSLMDLVAAPEAAGDQVQANVVVDGGPPLATLPVLKAPRILFNCIHFEEASRAARRLRPQPVKPWTQRFRAIEERYEQFVKLPRPTSPVSRIMRSRSPCNGACTAPRTATR